VNYSNKSIDGRSPLYLQLEVEMDRFFDPDVPDHNIKYSVVDKYEWAITDQSKIGRTHTKWKELDNYTISISSTKVCDLQH
jgi:hypothetical protein